MTAHDNLEVVPRGNQHVGTMDSRLRDFIVINLPTFYESKVEEDPLDFINEVHKILYSMGLTTSENAELPTYQLKYVA